MPQVKMKKPISDRFHKYIEESRGNNDPHEVACRVLVDAIALLRKEHPFVRKIPIMEESFRNDDDETIYYSDIVDIEPIVNSVKIHTALTSRRQIIREAIIAFLIDKKIIIVENERLVCL